MKYIYYVLVLFHSFALYSNEQQTQISANNTTHTPKDKWFVIIHENATADVVRLIPEYAEFANKGTYFSNFHALTNPSQPNYIGLIAGDMFQPPFYDDDVVDFPNSNHPEATSTIIDLIEEKGLSWKVYLENYPSPGFTGSSNLPLNTFTVVNDFKVTSGPAKGDYPVNYATFGPQVSFPETTLIATANLDGTPEKNQDFSGKIVLIPRGEYDLTRKTKNAQTAGARGVIIYNTQNGDGTFTPGGFFALGGDDLTIHIPTYGLSYADGRSILAALLKNPTTKGLLDVTKSRGSQSSYVRKHNPFISFLSISKNPERAAKLVNAQELADDIANETVPDFAFYIPNQFNNSHNSNVVVDRKTGTQTYYYPKYAGEMFNLTFGLALKTKSFTKDRVIVLTFDENDYNEPTNKIYCAFYGENVKAQTTVTSSYNLYDLLRTIEDSLGVGSLGRNDSTATPMEGWRK